jgi:hypothetical protein
LEYILRATEMDTGKDYFDNMLLDLMGIEDDLVANGAPLEAVRHLQEAIRICREYSKIKFDY